MIQILLPITNALPLVAAGLAVKGIGKLAGKRGKKGSRGRKLLKKSKKGLLGRFKGLGAKGRVGPTKSRGTRTLRKRLRRATRQLERIALKRRVLGIEKRVQRAKLRYLS